MTLKRIYQICIEELAKKSFWGIIAGLGVLGSLLWGLRNSFSSLDLVLLGVLLAGLTWLVAWMLYRRFSYRSYYYPKVGHHFEALVQEVRYILRPDGLHFTKCWKIKASQDMVDHIVDRFIWTGTQKRAYPIAGKNTAAVQERFQAGIWSFFTVTLNQALRRGDEWEFDYSWPILADPQASSPFVSMSTDQPTRLVRFVIQLGPAAAGKSVLVEELRAIESIYPLKTTKLKFDKDGRFEHDIDAKLYRHYRVRWTWEHGLIPSVQPQVEAAGEAK